jgi:hypothetical protein
MFNLFQNCLQSQKMQTCLRTETLKNWKKSFSNVEKDILVLSGWILQAMQTWDWTGNIYIYIYIYIKREREREREILPRMSILPLARCPKCFLHVASASTHVVGLSKYLKKIGDVKSWSDHGSWEYELSSELWNRNKMVY